MQRKLIFIIIIIILITSTGCWGKRELNELSVVSATGVDLEPDGSIRITVISIMPVGAAGTAGLQRSNAWIGTATGKNIASASKNLGKIATKRLAWFHNRIILIGEDLAKKGVGDVMDYIARNREFRYENSILVTKGRATDMLTVPADIEKHLVTEIDGIIENIKQEWPRSYIDNFKGFLMTLSEKNKGHITGILDYYETSQNTFSTNREDFKKMDLNNTKLGIAYIEGSAVFKEDKLVGWLDGQETRGYILLTEGLRAGVITTDYKDRNGKISLELLRSKSSIKAQPKENKITMNIKLEIKGSFKTGSGEYDILKEADIEEMERIFAKEIESQVSRTVKKAQKELNTDFLGFGEHIFRNHPGTWRKISDRWDAIFPEIDVNYDVKVRILRTGMISEPIY